ncbi:MAG: hypothetical protein WCF85_13355, partial [Rhodospirillaceae bacterium]
MTIPRDARGSGVTDSACSGGVIYDACGGVGCPAGTAPDFPGGDRFFMQAKPFGPSDFKHYIRYRSIQSMPIGLTHTPTRCCVLP